MKKKLLKRRIEFNGFHKHDSLVIGNHGNVDFVAKGHFELTGLVFCKHTVSFKINGTGVIAFNGYCNILTIVGINGDCILDLTRVSCKEINCEAIRGKSMVLLGPAKIIRVGNLAAKAVLKYTGKPLILSYGTTQGSHSLPGNRACEIYNNDAEMHDSRILQIIEPASKTTLKHYN